MGKNLSGLFSGMGGMQSLLSGQPPQPGFSMPSLLEHAVADSDLSKPAKQRGHFGSTLLSGGATGASHFLKSLLSEKG